MPALGKEPVLSAHATRNPTQPVQQPRKRAAPSAASKASREAANARRHELDLGLQARFAEIFQQREEDIVSLAKEFEKPEKYIRQVLENSVHYGSKRAVTLKNAITHELSKQARENSDASNAQDHNLSGQEYTDYVNSLSEERKQELLDQLTDFKSLKAHGIRATNKAAAMDAMQTGFQLENEMVNLFARTGVQGFLMLTRGHPDDSALPCFYDSGESRKFFPETLDLSPFDLVRKHELWSCNRDDPKKRGRESDAVRAELSEAVEDGLQKATRDKTLKMSWAKYKVDVVHKHGVEMAGWLKDVEMQPPSKMPIDDARRILSKIKSGGISWVGLTKPQREAVAAEVEELRTSGAHKHKERSDKGILRGPHKKKNNTGRTEGEHEVVATSVAAPAAAASGNTPLAAVAAPTAMSLAATGAVAAPTACSTPLAAVDTPTLASLTAVGSTPLATVAAPTTVSLAGAGAVVAPTAGNTSLAAVDACTPASLDAAGSTPFAVVAAPTAGGNPLATVPAPTATPLAVTGSTPVVPSFTTPLAAPKSTPAASLAAPFTGPAAVSYTTPGNTPLTTSLTTPLMPWLDMPLAAPLAPFSGISAPTDPYTMGVEWQLGFDPSLEFDFGNLDLSVLQQHSAVSNFDGDGDGWRLNTSNRKENWPNGLPDLSNNGAGIRSPTASGSEVVVTHVNSTNFVFPAVPASAGSANALGLGPTMSVFSVATNTSGTKRKRVSDGPGAAQRKSQKKDQNGTASTNTEAASRPKPRRRGRSAVELAAQA
ncbi:hypothetical protein C8R45DRAFT_1009013 [Mycena sanguinolenta]|nr:hypothetical protein C8R45DRAFT_1009013 [Mycena sanguinolenta]